MWSRFVKQSFSRVRQQSSSFSADAILGLIVLPVGCAGLLFEAYFRTDLGNASTAAESSSVSTSRVFTAAHVRILERDGIVVIPNALSEDDLKQARFCVQELQSSFETSGNETSVRQDRVQWVQGCDVEGDKSTTSRNSLQEAVQLIRGVANVLDECKYLKSGNFQVPLDCQLAVYQGNNLDGYERHLDRCTDTVYDLGLLEFWRLSDFRSRVITSILYLNDPRRLKEEGGQLRCWANDNNMDKFFDITPVGGTLVVFDASRIHHQVLPSNSLRVALTSWVHGIMASED